MSGPGVVTTDTTPGILSLGVHTELRPPILRQLAARHPLGPLEPVLLHHGQAAELGALADRPAGGQRPGVGVQADGGVHRAQEEPEVGRALDLDQRPELVNFETGLKQ